MAGLAELAEFTAVDMREGVGMCTEGGRLDERTCDIILLSASSGTIFSRDCGDILEASKTRRFGFNVLHSLLPSLRKRHSCLCNRVAGQANFAA